MEIHFTDNSRNEFYLQITDEHEVQVWKNKLQITDVRVYIEEKTKSIKQSEKMEKFRITRHSCTTYLDSYEHGELQEVNSHSIERHEEFDSMEELLLSLNAHIGANYNAKDFLIDDEAIQTDVLCKFINGFYFRANEKDISLWKEGLIDLYNCHHLFYAERIVKLKLTKEDEKESLFSILGNALNPNN